MEICFLRRVKRDSILLTPVGDATAVILGGCRGTKGKELMEVLGRYTSVLYFPGKCVL